MVRARTAAGVGAHVPYTHKTATGRPRTARATRAPGAPAARWARRRRRRRCSARGRPVTRTQQRVHEHPQRQQPVPHPAPRLAHRIHPERCRALLHFPLAIDVHGERMIRERGARDTSWESDYSVFRDGRVPPNRRAGGWNAGCASRADPPVCFASGTVRARIRPLATAFPSLLDTLRCFTHSITPFVPARPGKLRFAMLRHIDLHFLPPAFPSPPSPQPFTHVHGLAHGPQLYTRARNLRSGSASGIRSGGT